MFTFLGMLDGCQRCEFSFRCHHVSIQSIHTLEISDDSLTMARTQFQTISRDTNSTFVQRGVVGLGDEDESVQGHSQEIPRV